MQEIIKCSHILQKHKDSGRPFDSFRNKQVTRTKEEALTRIKAIREKLVTEGVNSENFKKYALENSECSSASNGGDLGLFGKGEMQKAFEDAAYQLKNGELSEPIETDSGIHIIYKTG